MQYSRSSSFYIHSIFTHGLFVPRCTAGSTEGDRRLLGREEKVGGKDTWGEKGDKQGLPREYEQMRKRWCLIVGHGVTTQRSISRKRETGKRTEVENKRSNWPRSLQFLSNSLHLNSQMVLSLHMWCITCMDSLCSSAFSFMTVSLLQICFWA